MSREIRWDRTGQNLLVLVQKRSVISRLQRACLVSNLTNSRKCPKNQIKNQKKAIKGKFWQFFDQLIKMTGKVPLFNRLLVDILTNFCLEFARYMCDGANVPCDRTVSDRIASYRTSVPSDVARVLSAIARLFSFPGCKQELKANKPNRRRRNRILV